MSISSFINIKNEMYVKIVEIIYIIIHSNVLPHGSVIMFHEVIEPIYSLLDKINKLEMLRVI